MFVLVFSLSINTAGATTVSNTTRSMSVAPTRVKVMSLASAPNLKLNDTSPYVIQIQKFLNSRGYIVNNQKGQAGSVGHEVSKFGVKTQQAIAKFQKYNKITPADGKFGPKTRARMEELNNAVYKKASTIKKSGNVLGASTDTQITGSVLGDSTNESSGSGITVTAYNSDQGSITLDISSSTGGDDSSYETDSNPINTNVPAGSTVNLTAYPNEHMSFLSWSWTGTTPSGLTGCDSGNTLCSFAMPSQTVDVSGLFSTSTNILDIYDSTGNGQGTTSLTNVSPSQTQTSGNNIYVVYYNTSVTLTATPTASSEFAGWVFDQPASSSSVTITSAGGEGGVSGTGGSNSITFTLDQDIHIHAVFNLKKHNLSVSGIDAGSGTVTSDPTGINCSDNGGNGCSKDYDDGTIVHLTATPSAGYKFVGWNNDLEDTTNPKDVTLYASTSVTAKFQKESNVSLTVSLTGERGKGTVTSPDGINCVNNGDAGCSKDYTYGGDTTVNLTAHPSQGYSVTWTNEQGTTLSTSTSYSVTMSSYNQNISANFHRSTHTLTIKLENYLIPGQQGHGTIVGANVGDNTITEGDPVTLGYTPDEKSQFMGVGGTVDSDCNDNTAASDSSTSLTIHMCKDRTLTFDFANKPKLTVTTDTGSGSGSVSGTASGNSTFVSGNRYPRNTIIDLTPTADSDSDFEKWTGDTDSVRTTVSKCPKINDSNNTCEKEMYYDDQTVNAVFTLKPTYRLTTQKQGTGSGTITLQPQGTNSSTDASGPSGTYYKGQEVTVTANATPGSHFGGFFGTCSATQVNGNTVCNTSLSVTMDGNKNITALFIDNRLGLGGVGADGGTGTGPGTGTDTGTSTGGGPGTVTPPPTTNQKQKLTINVNGIVPENFTPVVTSDVTRVSSATDANNNTTMVYNQGTNVTISGSTADGSSRITFGGNCVGTVVGADCKLNMSTDKTITMTLTQGTISGTKTATVKASISGGSKSGSISGLSSSATKVTSGTDLVLKAIPNDGYMFLKWSGCPNDNGDNCKLKVIKDVNITAFFKPFPTYSVSVKGSNISVVGGVIGHTPVEIKTSQKYVAGTLLEFVITAITNHILTSVTGCGKMVIEGNKVTCDIVVGDSAVVINANTATVPTAKLTIKVHNVSGVNGVVNYSSEGNSSVSGSVSGTSVNTGTKTLTLNQGKKVTLTPNPVKSANNTGKRLDQWKGCVTPFATLSLDGNTCIWLGSRDATIDAYFLAY